MPEESQDTDKEVEETLIRACPSCGDRIIYKIFMKPESKDTDKGKEIKCIFCKKTGADYVMDEHAGFVIIRGVCLDCGKEFLVVDPKDTVEVEAEVGETESTDKEGLVESKEAMEELDRYVLAHETDIAMCINDYEDLFHYFCWRFKRVPEHTIKEPSDSEEEEE